MTAYNREKYIGQAIESVLASNYTHFELIIVDDCSKDSTRGIASRYADKDQRISVYSNEENLGDYPNRNKAASYAKGKYLKYLDADDIIYYYGLEVMVNYMLKFPEAGFGLSGKADERDPFPICLSPAESYREHFNGYGHFHRAPGSSIIRLDAFRGIGGFSGERMIGDFQLWLTIARYFPMVKLPADMYWNRRHDGQESQTEYVRDNYNQLFERVTREALTHPDCPLPEPERRTHMTGIHQSLLSRIGRKLFRSDNSKP